MADFNNCSFAGRLTRDPEIKTVGNDDVCNASIAVNGYKEGEVLFLNVEVWGKQGQALKDFNVQGDEISVKGELWEQKWTDRDTGTERKKLVLKKAGWNFGRRKGEGKASGGNGAAEQRESAKHAPRSNPSPASHAPKGGYNDTPDDDIPF